MSDATLVTIAGPRLSATVSTLGAELQTLVDGDGQDLLWNGDPAYWTGRAPLLFPVVGRLKDDRYRLGGRSFVLPQHGFARRSSFRVSRSEPSAVTMVLEDDEATHAAYPFAFRLEVTHAIDGARLTTAARLVNSGGEVLPASFGFHHAFRWPLPFGGSKQEHEILFDRDEPDPIRRPDGDGLLSAEINPTPVDGRRLALSDDLFSGGALVFRNLRSRSLVFGVPGRPHLRVEFPDSPDLGLWTKPGAGAPYLCIEPWQGHADPAGFTGDLTDKPGIVMLQPGESRTWRMDVEAVG